MSYSVVLTLLYEEAVQYIQEIVKETVALNEIIIISRPELSALIRAKSGVASNRGIKFEVTIQSSLHDLAIKPHELNIVIGNVIDNALDAVVGLDSLHKTVSLSIAQTESTYIFRIINKGNIDQVINDWLFQKGVTSKGARHMGLGLYITKELVEKNGGTVNITSDESSEKVICLIELPKSRR
jgi:sensor histidine kinase regulating citrate/malate metabolism